MNRDDLQREHRLTDEQTERVFAAGKLLVRCGYSPAAAGKVVGTFIGRGADPLTGVKILLRQQGKIR